MSSVFPITDDPRYRRITASAGQTVFAIGFPFLQNEDISIFLQTAPSEYTPFSSSAYTLSGANNPAGGSATLHAPRAEGDIILILGEAVLDRMSSIVRDGKFSSALVDGELDRIRIIQQELGRDAGRAIKVDYGGEGVTLANDLEDGDVLMKQGDRLVRGPAAGTITSAEAFAQIASDKAYEATLASGAAAASETAAASSANLSQKWANNAEDIEVIAGSGLFSAFHWYRKVLAIWAAVVAGFVAAINNATAKSSLADADILTGTDSATAGNPLIKFTLANLVASIFRSTRTIANAQFAAASFKIFNASVPPRALLIGVTALSADRTLSMPNRDVDLSQVETAFGRSQSWTVHTTATRVGGTAYQNTTGRTIYVIIQGSTTSTQTIDTSPDNLTWASLSSGGTSQYSGLGFFPVRPGDYYRLSSGAYSKWSELS